MNKLCVAVGIGCVCSLIVGTLLIVGTFATLPEFDRHVYDVVDLVLEREANISANRAANVEWPKRDFWGFRFGDSFDVCASRVKDLKRQGILTDVLVGTVIAGSWPAGTETISGNGSIDVAGILSSSPSALTLAFSRDRLIGIEIRYGFKRQQAESLFELHVRDLAKLLGGHVRTNEWETVVGNRHRGAYVECEGIRASVEDILDGPFAVFAPSIRIWARSAIISTHPREEGGLVLVGVPGWVNSDLKAKVVAAAGGDRFPIREETAEVVARNLARMSWLDDIEVHVTHDTVHVQAAWRKPVARIEQDPSKFYVDADLVVLDYMPMGHLPIVEVKGVSLSLSPSPGAVFDQDDLAAAVKLIILLNRMDADVASKSALLDQIATVDVTNYKGRKNHRAPHIVFNTKDGTLILWGAEIGEWARHLEAKDEQKLAKLYTHYKEFGSLSAGDKHINLYDPQDKAPQPVDRYR